MQEREYIQEDEIDLRDLFKTIWDKRKFIVLFTSVVTLLAIGYAMSKTPIYEVKSVVRIGYLDDKLVEDSNVLTKKLRLIFNVDSKNNNIINNNAIVSDISTVKKIENFIEIATQAQNNDLAISKNKEVVEFLQNEYKYKIDEYIIKVNQSIKNLEEKIDYVNKVEKVNLEQDILKVKEQSIPKIENKIDLLKNVEFRIVVSKLQFNEKKLEEYEKNLIKISQQKSSDDTQNMLMAMQILNTQNLILNLQNTIENLKKEKENIVNIEIKDLELQKENLLNETIRKLNVQLDIDLQNKLDDLNDQLEAQKRKLTYNNIKNSEVVGQIQVSENPIKPKKSLIVVVAFVTGFILSIFLVFFMQFIASFKEEKKND